MQIDLFRIYISVATKAMLQIRMSFPDIFFSTLQGIKRSNSGWSYSNNVTQHAHWLKTIISDKVSAFVSQVISKRAVIQGITLEHAKTKHAKKIDVLERAHGSLKKALKKERGERRSLWQKYVNLAVLNYNTSNHTSFECKPSRLFHGCIPYEVFDFKIGIPP